MKNETVIDRPASADHPLKRRRMQKSVREALEFYCFISPWFIMFILLGLIPLLYGLYLSFTNFTGFNAANLRFVGIRNYERIFTDSDSMYALGRTFFITALNVPLGTFLGFLMAVLLNNSLKGVGVFRTIFYLPSITGRSRRTALEEPVGEGEWLDQLDSRKLQHSADRLAWL